MTYVTVCYMLFSLVLSSNGLLQNTKNLLPGDERFQDYLTSSFQNYHVWLQENKTDPTEPISGSLLMETHIPFNVYLTCELQNQQMLGHSSNAVQMYGAESSFGGYFFEVWREYQQTIQFRGDFKCNGILESPDNETIWFHGNGSYKLNTTSSTEYAGYTNVGITEDHVVNLTISQFTYALSLRYRPGVFSEYYWNDTRINETYLGDVENEFIRTFSNYMRNPNELGIANRHPSLPLIKNYLFNLTQNLDLKTIIFEEEDLPTPYIPTANPPSTTPVPTSSTPTAASTQAASQTTTQLSSTTADENSGADILRIHALIITLCVTLFHFLLKCTYFIDLRE